MMKLVIALMSVILIIGCACLLPSIQSKHPSGYEKLISALPACKEPDTGTYGACLNSADMLESRSPQQAVSKFIAHWEQSVFGMAADMKRSGMNTMVPDGRDFAGSQTQWKQAKALEQISLPTLRHILGQDQSAYAKKILPQIDLIIPMSKESLNTFREVHSRSL